jgi:hypothetical protein
MFHPKSICFSFSALLVIAMSWTATSFASHPYHVSYAEVEWNARTGNFEVALCVWPADLEKAISVGYEKNVDLDEIENLDELLQQLVQQQFRVVKTAVKRSVDKSSNAVNRPRKLSTKVAANQKESKLIAQPIRWVGHELSLKKAWLYFEVIGGQQAAEWEIENRIFFNLNENQENHMRFTINDRVENLQATGAAAKHTISARTKKASTKY